VERSNPTSGEKFNRVVVSAGPESTGERLDTYLALKLPELTRSRIKRIIDEGRIATPGGLPVKRGQRLKGDETFELLIPEPQPLETRPEEIALNILYEDSSIILVDKPSGMVVHPAPGHFESTLVNALLYHCKDLSGIGGKLRPGIVHRLDKDTSGIILVTKTDRAHNEMSRQFKDHSIVRKYKALVYGTMEHEGTIALPLGRHPRDRKKIAVLQEGRRAVTHWKVLGFFKGITFLELKLETGRTHQIRVHLFANRHPVIGDQHYGSVKRSLEISSLLVREKVRCLKSQALHAYFLGFRHPESGEYMEFTSPLPGEMHEIVNLMHE